jgi:hypothetical protein
MQYTGRGLRGDLGSGSATKHALVLGSCQDTIKQQTKQCRGCRIQIVRKTRLGIRVLGAYPVVLGA